MIVARSNEALKNALSKWRYSPDKTIGFVPTMGYLHPGHTSLIDLAADQNNCVVVSIYVNPTQFGPNEDFTSYPRNEERDLELCRQHGADVVFIPETSVMYPMQTLTYVTVKKLTDCLCGRYRPGHFDGVTTIVAKLFLTVQPDRAYFGQKDAQQVLVIQRMVRELLFPVDIRIGPTVRESDGLAMSSRNVRLSHDGRRIAPRIFEALQSARTALANGETSADTLINIAMDILKEHSEFNVQYLEIRRQDSLESISQVDQPAILATAVFLDEVRLIDNVFLFPPEVSDVKPE